MGFMDKINLDEIKNGVNFFQDVIVYKDIIGN